MRRRGARPRMPVRCCGQFGPSVSSLGGSPMNKVLVRVLALVVVVAAVVVLVIFATKKPAEMQLTLFRSPHEATIDAIKKPCTEHKQSINKIPLV